MRNNSKKYCDLIKNDEGVIKFLDSLIDYYELDDYIFTHGYIPIVRFFGKLAYNPYWKNATKRMWDDARFYNGMELCSVRNVKIPNKTVVVGHYRCSYGNVRKEFGFDLFDKHAKEIEFSNIKYFEPYYNDGIIAIDSTVYLTKKVNCIVIEDV